MHRTFSLGLAALVAAAAVPASAQMAPGDTGAGTKLGLAARNGSGQVGSVTLEPHGERATLVALRIFSVPPGRRERAHVHRGDCDGDPAAPSTFALAPVADGVSRTVVALPEDRLLSGNYAVDVHGAGRGSPLVSCGTLYR